MFLWTICFVTFACDLQKTITAFHWVMPEALGILGMTLQVDGPVQTAASEEFSKISEREAMLRQI